MQRRLYALTLGLAVFAAAWLSGCATMGGPRVVTLSEADLQRLVEREFPHQRRVLELIDVTVARPTLRLLPERNRLGTALDLSATERLGGNTVRGSLDLDYALRFEPADATVRMTQVQVLGSKLDLGSGPLSPSANRVGALLAERLLDDFVLYRADARRVKQMQQAGVMAADVVVTPRGVEIRFADPR